MGGSPEKKKNQYSELTIITVIPCNIVKRWIVENKIKYYFMKIKQI